MGENPSRVLRVLYFSADDARADQGKIDCGLMDVKTISKCNAALVSAFSWNIALEWKQKTKQKNSINNKRRMKVSR